MSVESQRVNDITVLITGKQQFVLAFHLRLISFFYANQLMDIFAYDVPLLSNPPTNQSFKPKESFSFSNAAKTQRSNSSNVTNRTRDEKNISYSAVVHILHFLQLQRRIFIFVLNSVWQTFRTSMHGYIQNGLRSFDDLYKNSWWAEREVGELFGVDFIGKSDIRNLLLQYGMTDHPMQKFFPVIGTSEVVYYQLIDAVIKIPLALQY